jgi:hypothetical protein
MQTAINKKFPKLAASKTDDKARTVLVLAQNDIQLTDPGTDHWEFGPAKLSALTDIGRQKAHVGADARGNPIAN